MSAPDEIGMAADAEALNLANEVRRILADGQPRTTRQIADLSRLTQGGDDVSKTVYLLRLLGEVQTDVVDGARLHRLIPGGIRPPREPARPASAAGARHASPSQTATEDSARGRASHEAPSGSGAPPRTPDEEPRGSGAPPRMPVADTPPAAAAVEADDVILLIDDRGWLRITPPNSPAIALNAALTRRLLDFLADVQPLLDRLAEPAP